MAIGGGLGALVATWCNCTALKPVPPNEKLDLGEPYCGACGQRLTGLVDSSKCPECGRPIVDVVTRAGKLGNRFRSQATLFGLPLVDIAFGGTHDEPTGSARGVFAFGDKARGCVAVGRTSATGIVAIGGFARGVFAIGGCSFGLVSSLGGVSVGGLAAGGLVLGLLAFGGLCAGVVAAGGVAAGLYARGALPIGAISAQATLGAAGDVFQMLSWFFGQPGTIWAFFLQPNLIALALPLVVAAAFGILVAWRQTKSARAQGQAMR